MNDDATKRLDMAIEAILARFERGQAAAAATREAIQRAIDERIGRDDARHKEAA